MKRNYMYTKELFESLLKKVKFKDFEYLRGKPYPVELHYSEMFNLDNKDNLMGKLPILNTHSNDTKLIDALSHFLAVSEQYKIPFSHSKYIVKEGGITAMDAMNIVNVFVKGLYSDFNNPAELVERFTRYIEAPALNEEVSFGYINSLEAKLSISNELNGMFYETPYSLNMRLDGKDGEYHLPKVEYGLDYEKKVAYIYGIQNTKLNKVENVFYKKINRTLRRLDKGVSEVEASEFLQTRKITSIYASLAQMLTDGKEANFIKKINELLTILNMELVKDYKEALDVYKCLLNNYTELTSNYSENVTDISPNMLVSLLIATNFFKKLGYQKIMMADFQPLEYDLKEEYFMLLLNDNDSAFSVADYHAKIDEIHKILSNVVDKFFRTARRLEHHVNYFNITCYPQDFDSYMHISLSNKYDKEIIKNEIIEEITEVINTKKIEIKTKNLLPKAI